MKSGHSFSGFDIVRPIGVGATSEVFLAKHIKTGSLHALKVFSNVISQDPELVRRLKTEADILGSFRHPNIVSLYESIRNESDFGLDLEFVDGSDLRKWLNETGHRTQLVEPRVWLLAQLARGLGAAHEKGILHRDLKPENILISRSGEVKITDFGLARSISQTTITRVGLLVGSLGYMAPEVISGSKATVQSDIFSFGVMAYEVLSGESPFQSETPQGMIHAISTGKRMPLSERAPHIPLKISALVDSCLALNPEERPESIWRIEADMMTWLSACHWLQAAPKLLVDPVTAEDLTKAYAVKHTVLSSRIETLRLATESSKRAELYQSLAELRRLFPDDKILSDLTMLSGKYRKPSLISNFAGSISSRRAMALTFPILIGLMVGMFSWYQSAQKTVVGALGSPTVSRGSVAALEAVVDTKSLEVARAVKPSVISAAVPVLDSVSSGSTTKVPTTTAPVIVASREAGLGVGSDLGSGPDSNYRSGDTSRGKKEINLGAKSRSSLVVGKKTPKIEKASALESTSSSEAVAKPAEIDINGAVRFELPPDVSAFVNQVKVPSSQLKKYVLPEGKYQIRLVKEGYLPIDNVVDVKQGRTAVVRAGGEQ
jgi:serine/threonine protein kinase